MMKKRLLCGLAAGLAAVVLVSGCGSKEQRMSPAGAKGLLSSRDIVPPPYGRPADLKMLPPAAPGAPAGKVQVADKLEPMVVPMGNDAVPEPELDIADARLKSIVTPPAAKPAEPEQGFVPVPAAPAAQPAQPIMDLGQNLGDAPATAPQPKQTYVVKRGDTLTKIARLYGVTWKDIALENKLTAASTIQIGQTLTLPAGAKYDASKAEKAVAKKTVAAAKPAPVRSTRSTASKGKSRSSVKPLPKDGKYTVKAGDSLWRIADRYGLRVKDIRAWNHLRSDMLQIDQVLILKGDASAVKTPASSPSKKSAQAPSSTRSASVSGKKVSTGLSADKHIVKSGDSVWKIARQYKISQDDLMSWNNLKTANLQVNQVLLIRKPGSSPAAPAVAASAPADKAEKNVVKTNPALGSGTVSGMTNTGEVVNLNAPVDAGSTKVSAVPNFGAQPIGGNEVSEYTVREGDTLDRLLQENGIQMERFRELNPKIDPSQKLVPGTILMLPF